MSDDDVVQFAVEEALMARLRAVERRHEEKEALDQAAADAERRVNEMLQERRRAES